MAYSKSFEHSNENLLTNIEYADFTQEDLEALKACSCQYACTDLKNLKIKTKIPNPAQIGASDKAEKIYFNILKTIKKKKREYGQTFDPTSVKIQNINAIIFQILTDVGYKINRKFLEENSERINLTNIILQSTESVIKEIELISLNHDIYKD